MSNLVCLMWILFFGGVVLGLVGGLLVCLLFCGNNKNVSVVLLVLGLFSGMLVVFVFGLVFIGL